jgi:tetratricopeptide (TPR) repeat protein
MALRFLVDWSFRLNHAVSGLRPADFHLVNLLIHMANALLLYGIVARGVAPRVAGPSARWMGGAAALLWAVHPLQTESVTYICQRYESLMGFFFLLGLYGFVRGCAGSVPRAWFGVSLAACVLGMGTKEVMVAFPVVILLYDVLLVTGSWRETWRARNRLHTAYFLSWGVLGMLWLRSTALFLEADVYMTSRLSPVSYLLTQSEVLLHYLRLTVVPSPLCLDYGWAPVTHAGRVAGPLVFWGAMAGLTLWGVVRRTPWAMVGVWFLMILAPTSSIMPLDDLAFEHRMYLPLAGLIVPVVLTGGGCLLRAFAGRPGTMKVYAGLVLVVWVAAYGLVTFRRNLDYASELRIWSRTVEVAPQNLRARNLKAVALCERRRFTEGESEFRNVLEATRHVEDYRTGEPAVLANNSDRNNRFQAWANLGLLQSQRGEFKEAVDAYSAAIRVYPFDSGVFQKMEAALAQLQAATSQVQRAMNEELPTVSSPSEGPSTNAVSPETNVE